MEKYEIIKELTSRVHISGGTCCNYKVRNIISNELNTVKKIRYRYTDDITWQKIKSKRKEEKLKLKKENDLETIINEKPLTRQRRIELLNIIKQRQSQIKKKNDTSGNNNSNNNNSSSNSNWEPQDLMIAAEQLMTQLDEPEIKKPKLVDDDDEDEDEEAADLAFTAGISAETLREISILRFVSKHPNITEMREVVTLPEKNRLFMVFEYLEMNLREFYRECDVVSIANIKSVGCQLMKGLCHLHIHGVMHRDITPRNVFLTGQGTLKIANFEAARNYVPPVRTFSHEGFSIWYCAPEILLGRKSYGLPVDIWAAGAIIAELVNKTPVFAGDSEIDELYIMFRALGTPTEETWPGVSQLQDYNPEFPQWQPKLLSRILTRLPSSGIDLLERMLVLNPCRRISAKEAQAHDFLRGAPSHVELSPKAATFVAAAINECSSEPNNNNSSSSSNSSS